MEQATSRTHWKISGRVVGGAGKAAHFTQLDWVQEQCFTKLGFRPYPGTLNLEVAEKSLPVVEAMKREKGISLIPTEPGCCAARALPLTIGTVSGALIVPEESVNIHGKKIIEVMAPVRLKDALCIYEGDSVTLEITKPGS
jgi:CTP-dependent riboflavin kinase